MLIDWEMVLYKLKFGYRPETIWQPRDFPNVQEQSVSTLFFVSPHPRFLFIEA